MEEHEINPLDFVSVSGFTRQCGLKYTGIVLQNIKNQDLLSTIK